MEAGTVGRQAGRIDARIELPAEPQSVALARQFVRDVLCEPAWSDLTEVVTLLTSELVTNAIRHAHSPCTVQLKATTGNVRVEVLDDSPSPPVPRQVPPEAESGRGIELVDTLAGRWGMQPRPHGKAVWFDVDVR
jgi:anti-sigma regulatory factor (Ser/Thr protein kinase)